MEQILLGSEMKKVDNFTINELGIPSLVLMERAAYSVYIELARLCDKKSKILIVCGIGNNGADGLALARILHTEEYFVEVIIVGNKENATEEFKTQLKIIINIQVKIVEDIVPSEYTVIVDAIFGIGLKREIKDSFYELINKMNLLNTVKISIDVPSGLCADTGRILGIAFKADYTITFGKKKVGHIINNGIDFTGKLLVCNIGFPAMAYKMVTKYFAYNQEDLNLMPKRNENSNKGTFGKLLVIAGTMNMAGAAYLASKAAYRMGVGLVQILTVKENREILQTLIPEAVLITYDQEHLNILLIEKVLNEANVLVIGPGLGQSDTTNTLVMLALLTKKRIVLDADALNAIAADPKLVNYYHPDVIITPHLGEMSRLIGVAVQEIKNNLISTCRDYASKYNINCILKDAKTISSNGEKVFINTSGNSGMASAGSGDVLSGIIGGLLALNVPIGRAGPYGAFLHGMAGDSMADKYGKTALMATDIIDGLLSISKRG